MIKNIYTKWEELLNEVNKKRANCVLEYYLSKKANNRVYFCMNNKLEKKIYIEFEKKVISNYESPNIFGIQIYKDVAPHIDATKDYLCIANASPFEEVFLAFNSTLVDMLTESLTNDQTIKCIEETIKLYKYYFSNPNKGISENEEQGLCGELLYLEKLIKKNGEKCVINWLGPNNNKHDFVFDDKAIEIKTTLNQAEKSITISNENQLDSSKLEELKLVVYVLEKNPNGDVDIISCSNKVLSLLTDVQFIKVFKSKLLMKGIDLACYKTNNKYTVEDVDTYIINDRFPCLTKSNIPDVVFNVTYKINLNSLSEYKCGDENE